jgi:GGDEF domain-containing protein
MRPARIEALAEALRQQFHTAAHSCHPEAVTLSIGAHLFDRPPASLAALIEQGDRCCTRPSVPGATACS